MRKHTWEGIFTLSSYEFILSIGSLPSALAYVAIVVRRRHEEAAEDVLYSNSNLTTLVTQVP